MFGKRPEVWAQFESGTVTEALRRAGFGNDLVLEDGSGSVLEAECREWEESEQVQHALSGPWGT